MGNMNVLGGYDLIRERTLPKISLGKDLTPTLGMALQNNQVLRLPASSGSADMVYLGHRLSVQKVGHLMSVPVRLKDHGTVGGVVILSPYTMRTWNDDDQTRLTELAESTASYLQQFDALQLVQDELQHVRNAFQDIKLEKDSVLAEKQTLLARIQELQVMASTEQTQGEDLTTLQEELRLALQEIAILNADQGVSRASESGAELTRDDFAEIVAVAEELRQPMSSLVGYTDVLLAESHGILGERQRKIVERIRVANERITCLLDELIGNLNIEDTQFKHAKLQETDLATAIQTAITETEPVRQARQIGVRISFQKRCHLYKLTRLHCTKYWINCLPMPAGCLRQIQISSCMLRFEQATGSMILSYCKYPILAMASPRMSILINSRMCLAQERRQLTGWLMTQGL